MNLGYTLTRRLVRLVLRASTRLGPALVVAGLPARALAADAPPPAPAEESVTLARPAAVAAEPTPPATATAPGASAPGPELRKHWYGTATLTSDGASAFVIGLGLMNVGGTYAIVAGTAGYALGAPIVHLVHKRPLEALASFVLRVPAPLVIGGGAALFNCARVGDDTCGAAAVPPVATLITAAIVVDAALLSNELVPVEPKPHYASVPVRVTPTLSLTRREALVGVAVTL